MLAALHDAVSGLSREIAGAYLEEVYENRKSGEFFTYSL